MHGSDKNIADLKDLAAAVADIALGYSVILQLKPDLDEGHRIPVRAFLEKVVRVSATLERRGSSWRSAS